LNPTAWSGCGRGLVDEWNYSRKTSHTILEAYPYLLHHLCKVYVKRIIDVKKVVWLLEDMVNSFAAYAAALCGTRRVQNRKRAKRWLDSSAFATAFGHELVVEYLISKDVNVNAQTTSG
jgi:hypothetical protein